MRAHSVAGARRSRRPEHDHRYVERASTRLGTRTERVVSAPRLPARRSRRDAELGPAAGFYLVFPLLRYNADLCFDCGGGAVALLYGKLEPVPIPTAFAMSPMILAMSRGRDHIGQ
jgi:hypothetical protein